MRLLITAADLGALVIDAVLDEGLATMETMAIAGQKSKRQERTITPREYELLK
jgi:hypothetical protein